MTSTIKEIHLQICTDFETEFENKHECSICGEPYIHLGAVKMCEYACKNKDKNPQGVTQKELSWLHRLGDIKRSYADILPQEIEKIKDPQIKTTFVVLQEMLELERAEDQHFNTVFYQKIPTSEVMDKETFVARRTQIISDMLDAPDECGIYPTSKCYAKFDDLFDEITGCKVKSELQEMVAEAQEETPLDKFKDNLSTEAFGTTKKEVSDGICISCKKPVNIESLEDVDKAEFRISQICPKCFDTITYREDGE